MTDVGNKSPRKRMLEVEGRKERETPRFFAELAFLAERSERDEKFRDKVKSPIWRRFYSNSRSPE